MSTDVLLQSQRPPYMQTTTLQVYLNVCNCLFCMQDMRSKRHAVNNQLMTIWDTS